MSTTTTSSWLVPVRHPSPDALELWLERKAARGQVLNRLDAAGAVRMRFDSGRPRRIRYALERRSNPAPMHYFTFREDKGWDYVGRIGYVHLWRQEYTDTPPAGFIGENLGRRAALASIGLGVAAALSAIVAIVLGSVSATFDGSPDVWVPAVVLAVIAAVTGVTALAVGMAHRSASVADADRELTRV